MYNMSAYQPDPIESLHKDGVGLMCVNLVFLSLSDPSFPCMWRGEGGGGLSYVDSRLYNVLDGQADIKEGVFLYV